MQNNNINVAALMIRDNLLLHSPMFTIIFIFILFVQLLLSFQRKYCLILLHFLYQHCLLHIFFHLIPLNQIPFIFFILPFPSSCSLFSLFIYLFITFLCTFIVLLFCGEKFLLFHRVLPILL